MQFEILPIKQEENTTGPWYRKETKTWFRVYWKITLTPEEQKVVPLIAKTVVHSEESTYRGSKLYNSASESTRRVLDSPITWKVEDMIGEDRGLSFSTPGEARGFENQLRYEILPKIEALLFNNRPF